jgi:hypothetical protein
MYIVTYGHVAKRRLSKQRPLLSNARNRDACNNRRTVFSVVRAVAVSGQRLGKHVPRTTDTDGAIERRFICSPCRDVISRAVIEEWVESVNGELSSVSKAVKKRVSCKGAVANRRIYMRYLECVIQWDCYSSCVKIRCQGRARGDCNTLRTLVCVCQWSVKCSHESWACKWSINRVTNPSPVYSLFSVHFRC